MECGEVRVFARYYGVDAGTANITGAGAGGDAVVPGGGSALRRGRGVCLNAAGVEAKGGVVGAGEGAARALGAGRSLPVHAGSAEARAIVTELVAGGPPGARSFGFVAAGRPGAGDRVHLAVAALGAAIALFWPMGGFLLVLVPLLSLAAELAGVEVLSALAPRRPGFAALLRPVHRGTRRVLLVALDRGVDPRPWRQATLAAVLIGAGALVVDDVWVRVGVLTVWALAAVLVGGVEGPGPEADAPENAAVRAADQVARRALAEGRGELAVVVAAGAGTAGEAVVAALDWWGVAPAGVRVVVLTGRPPLPAGGEEPPAPMCVGLRRAGLSVTMVGRSPGRGEAAPLGPMEEETWRRLFDDPSTAGG